MHPTPNPKEKGLKTTSRKSPRKGSENHQEGKSGRTQTSLEDHAESSIHTMKVHTRSSFPRSSYPLTRSHHEARKIVLEIPKEKGRGK
jgi:hypothetical protein